MPRSLRLRAPSQGELFLDILERQELIAELEARLAEARRQLAPLLREVRAFNAGKASGDKRTAQAVERYRAIAEDYSQVFQQSAGRYEPHGAIAEKIARKHGVSIRTISRALSRFATNTSF